MFSNAKKCGEGQVSGMSEGQEELLRMEGVIEHVIYENQDSGYAVFEVNAGGEVHVVTGVVGEVNPGESVTLYGKFETHPAHGPQFRAATCEASMPQDLAATLAYLSSGALPYIGPATAKKLVEKFGADSLEVIANEPLRLTELRGITPDKAAAISNEFKRMFGVREAVDNVKRLRNHACIALWCGNNECQDAWLGWGWKCEIERQNKEYADKIWAQYRQQYHVTLPGVVREYAPGTFYWPSSPFAFEGEMSGTTDGDRHYWSVWHGKAPISDYDSEKSRFFSEYGFQSFPEFESVKRYAPYPEDWDIRSEVMMSHQRGGDHANGLIETYLLNEYKKPRDFRAFLYMNHVLQGDAIKTAIESHRRQMPYNMGTLFWQHNDCWPVASWASRDYYGRWKAQHYYVRKAYDDILISPVVEGDDLKVYAVSDRLENTSGRLQLQVCRFDGTVVYHWDKSVGISGNDSRVCFSAPLAKLLEGADRGTVYVRVDYTDKSGRVYHNNYCLGKQKDMDYPKVDLQTEVRSIDGGYEVTVSTDKFARAVCLSVADNESVYSDNYFDVQPKSSVQVQVRTRLSAEAFNASLRLTCLNNEF